MNPQMQQVSPQQLPQPVQTPPVGVSMPSSEELSQEQMRANLQQLMAKIQDKYQEFSTQKFSNKVQIQKSKSESLRQLFDLFQAQGINPNNPEEVKAFLDKIKENNPELYQQLEQALMTLMGTEQTDPSTQIPDTSTPATPATPPIDTLSPSSAPETNMNINPNEVSPQNI